jgi:hypothetical protein
MQSQPRRCELPQWSDGEWIHAHVRSRAMGHKPSFNDISRRLTGRGRDVRVRSLERPAQARCFKPGICRHCLHVPVAGLPQSGDHNDPFADGGKSWTQYRSPHLRSPRLPQLLAWPRGSQSLLSARRLSHVPWSLRFTETSQQQICRSDRKHVARPLTPQ